MATIIVETGAVVPNANSYISEVDAITYITNYTSLGADFVSYDAALFQTALIRAAYALDKMYGQNYAGCIYNNTQSLLYPRSAFIDKQGRSRSGATIHKEIKDAQVEMAVSIYNGNDPFVAVSSESKILSKSVTIEGAISTDVTYAPTSPTAPKDEVYSGNRTIERILSPIMIATPKITSIHL
jgi:hypothetical protein